MKTKRQIRISGLNDYIAVDLVDDKEKILEEVFYFSKNKPIKILLRDHEEHKWVQHNVNFDGKELIVGNTDLSSDFYGQVFSIKESEYEFELLDKSNSKPILTAQKQL